MAGFFGNIGGGFNMDYLGQALKQNFSGSSSASNPVMNALGNVRELLGKMPIIGRFFKKEQGQGGYGVKEILAGAVAQTVVQQVANTPNQTPGSH